MAQLDLLGARPRPSRSRTFRAAVAAALLTLIVILLALAGCSRSAHTTGSGPGETTPWEAAPPSSYVPRVKTLLTGLAATDAEVQAVTADPGALRGLVDQWMALPEFKARMLAFFRNGFQQNQVSMDDLATSLGLSGYLELSWSDQSVFERSVMDSFPLTAWALVEEGRPFHETVTTRRYMMTTAMMSVLSYADDLAVDDEENVVSRLETDNLQRLVLDPDSAATPAQSSAAYHPSAAGDWAWHLPITIPAACRTQASASGDPDYLKIASSPPGARDLFALVFGNIYFVAGDYGSACDLGDQRTPALLAAGDWSDWRMVTVEAIPATDGTSLAAPLFWDLPALRAATTLRLRTPRLGFFGTLAFDANWATSPSNQARVTANQTLIVALGMSIIPAAAIAPAPVSASDNAHSTDPACAGCHKVLDPLRQFFRQSYSFSYHEQTDAAQISQPATFQFGGVTRTGQGVGDLATILAEHPHFALGWVQKLQFWANSTAADESDPEMVRIAAAFQASGFDFRTLVRDLFTSPLVTLASSTQTTRTRGVTLAIARRDQLCAALSNRLGLADVCGLETPDMTWQQWQVNQLGLMIANDTYYRAAELPALPTDPDLFFRSSVEAVCQRVADRAVDGDPASRYSSDRPDMAIADFVPTVMGLPPSDPRAARAKAILLEHYLAATGAGAWTGEALRSAFTLACIAPSSVILGL